MRFIWALVAAVLGTVGTLPMAGAETAPPAPPVPILAMTPGLFPAFATDITDYVVRCDGTTPVQIDVAAPQGIQVGVAHAVPRAGSFTASVPLRPGQSLDLVVSAVTVTTHHVRCLPAGFPTWTVERTGTPQAGLYAVSPLVFPEPFMPRPGDPPYSVVFDNRGVPVWWMAEPVPTIAFWLSNGQHAWLHPSPSFDFEEHDPSGRTLRALDIAPGVLDPHDLIVLPNGNYLAAVNDRRAVDFSSWGGAGTREVLDHDIREFTPTGAVVWSWRTSDHVTVAETSPAWRAVLGTVEGPVDAYHLNSIEPTPDGYLVSNRHLDSILHIDRATGAIRWKLGGSPRPESLRVVGDPVFAAGGTITGGHDARLLPDGTVSYYDNGTGVRPPRVVRYAIDTTARTATLVEELTEPKVTSSLCCGSARKLPGGNWVVSWTASSVITETRATGDRTFLLQLAPGHFSYRAEPLDGIVTVTTLRAGMDDMVAPALRLTGADPVGAPVSATPASGVSTRCAAYDDAAVTLLSRAATDVQLVELTAGGFEALESTVDTMTRQVCAPASSSARLVAALLRTRRVAGEDRVATAAASSTAFAPGVATAYVASAVSSADALAGGPAAAKAGAPILLTDPAKLSAATAAELSRLKPQQIVLLGGPTAVSRAVGAELLAIAPTTRIGGADRYATAAMAATSARAPAPVVYVASGEAFPDAVSGGAAAARAGAPILLTAAGSLPSATRAAIAELKATSVVVVGGPTAVTDDVVADLNRAGITVTRVGGADRYETAALLTGTAPSGAPVLVATGEAFPDALVATALSARTGAVVLLTAATSLPAATASELRRIRPGATTVLGGRRAISATVEGAIAQAAAPTG